MGVWCVYQANLTTRISRVGGIDTFLAGIGAYALGERLSDFFALGLPGRGNSRHLNIRVLGHLVDLRSHVVTIEV